jgi:hypothetical protein
LLRNFICLADQRPLPTRLPGDVYIYKAPTTAALCCRVTTCRRRPYRLMTSVTYSLPAPSQSLPQTTVAAVPDISSLSTTAYQHRLSLKRRSQRLSPIGHRELAGIGQNERLAAAVYVSSALAKVRSSCSCWVDRCLCRAKGKLHRLIGRSSCHPRLPLCTRFFSRYLRRGNVPEHGPLYKIASVCLPFG